MSNGKELLFGMYNNEKGFNQMRAKTLLTKEPETITWLDTMTSSDVLWDVGACVGTYSIYAAVMNECKVVSFEPSANNFQMLQKNIFINEMHENIVAFPLALGTKFKYDLLLYNQPYKIGSSSNDVLTSKYTTHKKRKSGGCIVDSINNLVNRGIEYPTYLKIDVDGIENDIIKGATKVIPNLKSILIELYSDKKEDLKTIKKIESLGRVAELLLGEVSSMKTLSYGTHETLKLMPGYEQAIEQIKKKVAEEPSSGTSSDADGKTS